MSIMATNLQKEFSIANVEALFKTDFKEYYEETFNQSTPFWSQVTKTNDFHGKRLEFPVPIGYQSGIGSGSLPEHNNAPYGDVIISSKKMYALSRVDRESIMASMTDEGAFVRAISECISKTVEADVWNHSRAAFGNSDGSLGTIATSGVTDNGGGNYSIVISTATWKESNWEENQLVNVSTGTELFSITTVTPSTRTIIIQRQAGGIQVPAQAEVVYMQGSKDNDIKGLKGVLDATTGSQYGVTVSRRWKAYNDLLSYGAGVTPELMNKVVLGVEKQCGKSINHIVTSYVQYEKILNQLEDKKRYQMTSIKPKGMEGGISFEGVQFMSSKGPVPIFPDKHCDDDRMYFLNMDYIKYFRRPKSGWVKEDIAGNNGYLRVVGEDQLEARHATYGELFIAPPFHGVVSGLTT